jgi:hypothetical protein
MRLSIDLRRRVVDGVAPAAQSASGLDLLFDLENTMGL